MSDTYSNWPGQAHALHGDHAHDQDQGVYCVGVEKLAEENRSRPGTSWMPFIGGDLGSRSGGCLLSRPSAQAPVGGLACGNRR